MMKGRGRKMQSSGNENFPFLLEQIGMKKILCVVMVYYDFEISKLCIDSLLPYLDRLDLIIIENKSEFTESHFRPYLLDLVNKGQVSKYFLFNKNISINAGEIVFDSGHIDFGDSDYVIITDGDLLCENQDWLSEEINIMEKNTDVFICAVTLDTSNLPIEVFPSATEWAPGGIEHDMYFEDSTGVYFLLMRTKEYLNFLNYRKRNNLKLIDLELNHYCYVILNKKWVRTKKSLARHLTWDLYHDPGHPYSKLKGKKSYEQTWVHNSYCSYQIYTKYSFSKYYPLKKILFGYIEDGKKWIQCIFKGKSDKYREFDWQEQLSQIANLERHKAKNGEAAQKTTKNDDWN
jgi:hypothetical protein